MSDSGRAYPALSTRTAMVENPIGPTNEFVPFHLLAIAAICFLAGWRLLVYTGHIQEYRGPDRRSRNCFSASLLLLFVYAGFGFNASAWLIQPTAHPGLWIVLSALFFGGTAFSIGRYAYHKGKRKYRQEAEVARKIQDLLKQPGVMPLEIDGSFAVNFSTEAQQAEYVRLTAEQGAISKIRW